ncbi:MAG: Holliday junction branch migration protein RuvA [Candidatus Levyibacteriota bacterium]
MIGSLRGTVSFKDFPYMIIDVHGVGYKVLVSQSLLTAKHIGDAIEIFTHTHVREDALELYGFSDIASLKLFELLLSVSGIGPKTAINVFSLGEGKDIVAAIQRADADFFTGVPRLGKKNAQKIIIELKNKLGATAELNLSGDTDEVQQVVAALMGIGFSEKEARSAVKTVGDSGKDVSEKVRLALKYLGK